MQAPSIPVQPKRAQNRAAAGICSNKRGGASGAGHPSPPSRILTELNRAYPSLALQSLPINIKEWIPVNANRSREGGASRLVTFTGLIRNNEYERTTRASAPPPELPSGLLEASKGSSPGLGRRSPFFHMPDSAIHCTICHSRRPERAGILVPVLGAQAPSVYASISANHHGAFHGHTRPLGLAGLRQSIDANQEGLADPLYTLTWADGGYQPLEAPARLPPKRREDDSQGQPPDQPHPQPTASAGAAQGTWPFREVETPILTKVGRK